MKVNRQIFNSIQTVLRKRHFAVDTNKTWTELHTELSIGTLKGKKILLSKEDRNKLREFVINDTGIDPLDGDISGDRLTLADKTANEKLSNQTVFGNEIKLFRNNLAIQLSTGDALTPAGTYLSTTFESIDLQNFDKIIVVENGTVFKNWSNSVLPEDILDALVIYRGHDTGSRDVKELLKSKGEHTQIFAAVDFDPEGFRIALDFDADAILTPERYEELRLLPNINKDPEFTKQNNHKCESMIPLKWKPIWNWMHDSRTAITQESILVKNWPLMLLYK
jgi:hypothetical protein